MHAMSCVTNSGISRLSMEQDSEAVLYHELAAILIKLWVFISFPQTLLVQPDLQGHHLANMD